MTTVTMEVPDHLASVLNEIGEQLPLVIELGFSRLAPVSTQAYMEAVALFVQNPSPQIIADFRFSPEVEARIQTLAEKNAEDKLSKAETVELQRLSHLEGQLQLLKARSAVQLRSKA